jgi:hypothetical protein
MKYTRTDYRGFKTKQEAEGWANQKRGWGKKVTIKKLKHKNIWAVYIYEREDLVENRKAYQRKNNI